MTNAEAMNSVTEKSTGAQTISMYARATAVSGEYFCHRRHRKDARGSGQSLLASIRHQFTVAAIQRHASKQ